MIGIKKYFIDYSNLIGFIISMSFGALFWIIFPKQQVSIYIVISLIILIAILIWFLAAFIYKSKEKFKELEKELNSYKIFNNIPYPNVIRFNTMDDKLICFIRESKLLQQDNLYTLYYQCDNEQTAVGLLKITHIQTDNICQAELFLLHLKNVELTDKILSNDSLYIQKLFVLPSAKTNHIKEVFNYE